MGAKWFHWVAVPVYAGLVFAVFGDALRSMRGHWNNPDYSYCYLLPPLVAYLIWENRDEIRARPQAPTWWGTALAAGGLLLYGAGELGGEFYTLYLALLLVFLGIVWQHLGSARFRLVAFPLLLTVAALPLPNFLQTRISLQLQLVSSKLGVGLLRLFGMPAFRDGNVIDLGFTQLQVVEACSGLRYLIPLILLGLVLAHFLRGSWWRRALLALSTIPLAVLLNGVRIAATGLLHQRFGPGVADGFFHDFSGWVVFMVAFGLLLAELAVLGGRPSGPVGAARSQAGLGEKQARARPVLRQPQFWVVVVLLGLTVVASQAFEFRTKVPISRPLAEFPAVLGEWRGSRSSLEQRYLDALDFSDYVMMDFRAGPGPSIGFYTAYYADQRKGESIHSPETCLPGSGWAFDEETTVAVPVDRAGARSITVKRVVLNKMGHRQVAYFWFQMRGRVLTNAYQVKIFNFWDALTRRRTDGALVRLITPVDSGENTDQADARLRQFIRLLWPVLGEFLPG